MCPDSSRCVRTAKNMSELFKICPVSSEQPKFCLEMHYIFLRETPMYFFGRSRVMITHLLCMLQNIFTHFSSGRFLGALHTANSAGGLKIYLSLFLQPQLFVHQIYVLFVHIGVWYGESSNFQKGALRRFFNRVSHNHSTH